ncbi:dihydrodipicolinate synthase family protein, partial [Lutibacter sp.]
MQELIGTGVALVTPFNKDKSVDFEGLKRLVNYQIDNGINYLVILGTTGE